MNVNQYVIQLLKIQEINNMVKQIINYYQSSCRLINSLLNHINHNKTAIVSQKSINRLGF
jgi:hypothetical protein